MSELKPCPECDADPDLYMNIQSLARYGSIEIGAAYCSHCGQYAVPVSGKFINPGDFYTASHEAWNTRHDKYKSDLKSVIDEVEALKKANKHGYSYQYGEWDSYKQAIDDVLAILEKKI